MQPEIIEETNFNKLKEKIKKNKTKEIIFLSKDDELTRKAAEKLKIKSILISLENRKDYSKQRNSGFNEILAKIFKKNKIDLYIDFDELFNSKNKERILSKIIQNINLCKREKIQIKFYSKKTTLSPQEIKSLMLNLGAPTWMAKNCI